jgi:hypothetical protein
VKAVIITIWISSKRMPQFPARSLMLSIPDMSAPRIPSESELLADTLQLVHPDRHPPEYQQLAKRVTQELLALKPFVFPAPKPPEIKPNQPERDASARKAPQQQASKKQPYPCELCADASPYFYCTACKAEHEKRCSEEIERERAKHRKWYAQRKARQQRNRPPKQPSPPKPRNERQSSVRLIKSAESNLNNHNLSGLQAAILVAAFSKRIPSARGCDVSHAELLAEIWGWKPQHALRWTKADREKFNSEFFRVGDPRSQPDTHGAFSHIPIAERRSASASLSRALTRLDKRMLVSFVCGTGSYSGGLVLTPHGEQIAKTLINSETNDERVTQRVTGVKQRAAQGWV